jgi:hypothetical protein
MEAQIHVKNQSVIFVAGTKHAILTKMQALIWLSQLRENHCGSDETIEHCFWIAKRYRANIPQPARGHDAVMSEGSSPGQR